MFICLPGEQKQLSLSAQKKERRVIQQITVF
jgi:hypothetical protein